MPDRRTVKKARKDKRAGKAPTTQAGEFVRQEIRQDSPRPTWTGDSKAHGWTPPKNSSPSVRFQE
jgi:hypothetical protein